MVHLVYRAPGPPAINFSIEISDQNLLSIMRLLNFFAHSGLASLALS